MLACWPGVADQDMEFRMDHFIHYGGIANGGTAELDNCIQIVRDAIEGDMKPLVAFNEHAVGRQERDIT